MSCIICRSKASSVKQFLAKDRMYNIPGRFLIMKCPSCGFLSIKPRLKKHEISKYYPADSYYSYIDYGKSFFGKFRKYLIKQFYGKSPAAQLVFQIFRPVPAIPVMRYKGKIMDIGCGNGETLRILKECGWNTYGVDIDTKAIAYAKKSGLTHVFVGTHAYLSKFSDNYFDVIRAYHVIEHMDDPKEFMNLAYRKLKTGGECIIGTPNSRSFASYIFRTYWYNLDTPRHQQIFSPKTLEKLFRQSGFDVSELSFSSGGGILGSIQYLASESFRKRFRFIHNTVLYLICYPLDRISDMLGMGDVFVITGKKNYNTRT